MQVPRGGNSCDHSLSRMPVRVKTINLSRVELGSKRWSYKTSTNTVSGVVATAQHLPTTHEYRYIVEVLKSDRPDESPLDDLDFRGRYITDLYDLKELDLK